MGVDTSTRLFGCLLLEILKKIVISTMATANLHINGFLQKCSRVPEWHQSEYSFIWSGDHKNAEKHCAVPNARSSWKMVFDIRTSSPQCDKQETSSSTWKKVQGLLTFVQCFRRWLACWKCAILFYITFPLFVRYSFIIWPVTST